MQAMNLYSRANSQRPIEKIDFEQKLLEKVLQNFIEIGGEF